MNKPDTDKKYDTYKKYIGKSLRMFYIQIWIFLLPKAIYAFCVL